MAKKFKFSIELEGPDFNGDAESNFEVVYLLRKLADRVEAARGYSDGDSLAELDGIKVYSTSGVGAGKVTVK